MGSEKNMIKFIMIRREKTDQKNREMAEKIFNIGEVRTVSHCQHPLGRNLLSLKLQNHHKNCYHCHYNCKTIIRTVIIFSQSEGFPPVATGGNPGCHQNVHWHRWHEPYEWSVMVISKTTHQNAHYHHHWHRSHVITHQPYERSERANTRLPPQKCFPLYWREAILTMIYHYNEINCVYENGNDHRNLINQN